MRRLVIINQSPPSQFFAMSSSKFLLNGSSSASFQEKSYQRATKQTLTPFKLKLIVTFCIPFRYCRTSIYKTKWSSSSSNLAFGQVHRHYYRSHKRGCLRLKSLHMKRLHAPLVSNHYRFVQLLMYLPPIEVSNHYQPIAMQPSEAGHINPLALNC